MPRAKNVDLRSRIRELIRADSSLSLRAMAESSGVTKSRVQQIVNELGYEYRPGKPSWRKRRVPENGDGP